MPSQTEQMNAGNIAEWRPMLWPREWTDVEPLRLLADSPVNCVVLPEADDGAAAGTAIAAGARQTGLRVLFARPDGLVAPDGVRVIPDGVWPKVATRGDTDAIDAGPTGLPWIDSNGWRIHLSQATQPGVVPWVRFQPPERSEVIRSSSYSIAAADCEIHGARWLISLDSGLAAGLVAGNGAAWETWNRLADTLAFFRAQTAPADYSRWPALLGILSDFAGENEFLSHEFLNLITREYVPVRILLEGDAAPALDGLRMVVAVDAQPLVLQWRSALQEFVRAGGTLVVNAARDPGFGDPASPVPGLEYNLRTFGDGKIALATEGFEDPWRLAADAHVLLGRTNDLIRQSNAGSMGLSLMTESARGRARVSIVNYSGRPGLNPVTLTFLEPYLTARFRSLEAPAPAEVPVRREYGRSAVYLPRFSVCATLELEA